MNFVENSIDNYIAQILNEDIDEAMEQVKDLGGPKPNNTGKNNKSGSSAKNDSPEVTINYKKIDAMQIHSANRKALQLWFSEFKPKWKALKSKYKTASTISEQEKVLWEQKKLLLNCRDAILDIPEDALLNIACFAGIMTITFGLSTCIFSSFELVDAGLVGISKGAKTAYSVSHPSMIGSAVHKVAKAVGISSSPVATAMAPAVVNAPGFMSTVATIAECVGTVYSVLKILGMSIKNADPTNSLANQKFTGIMSKQALLVRINQYITKTDAQIREVVSGKIANLSNQMVKAMERYSDEYSQKIVDATAKAGNNMGQDMAKQSIDKYFKSGGSGQKKSTSGN